MHVITLPKLHSLRCLCLGALPLLAALCGSPANADDCSSSGMDGYLCGIPSAEDLVQIPDTHWIIASAFAGPDILNVINAREKSWRVLYPSENSRADHNAERFPDCSTAPKTGELITHGLHIAAGRDGHATLHAVSHGQREAIEVFDIHVPETGSEPEITWVGCIPTPGAQAANSVVALQDGSLLATIPLENGFEFGQAMEGIETGAVYRYSAVENSWQRLDETAQPYANGIEVSADEARFYVASSGLRKVMAYANTTPARIINSSVELSVVPDNLHRDSHGSLVTAGLDAAYAGCNPYTASGEFDLSLYAACPRPYAVISLDPESLSISTIARGSANPAFSNITMGIVVEGAVWVGTFGGDRVAYRPADGD